MARVLIVHDVVDVANWLARRPQRVADLSPFASEILDLVATDGSNRVAVSLEVHDRVGLDEAMAAPSPERAESIRHQGILAPFAVFEER